MQGLLRQAAASGQLLAAGPGPGSLFAALQATVGLSAAAGAAAAGRRLFTQEAGAAHPHHRYADSHRSWEGATTYRAVVQRGHPGEAAAGPAPGRRPEGPPSRALAALAAQHGVPDGKGFAAAVEKLQVERQHGLVQHAEGVALHLQHLGLGLETVGRMLQACPALFSFPAEERAEVLLAELMGERCGRSVAQAAELFIRCPALANTRHVMPSIVRLVSDNHGD